MEPEGYAQASANAMVRRWQKRPVVIEAAQWDGSVANATEIIDWVLAGDGTARFNGGSVHEVGPGDSHEHPAFIAIDTLEGTMDADVHDWIIRGLKGEYYPCKPDIFAASYRPAND